MKVNLSYTMDGQKLKMEIDREIVGHIQRLNPTDITTISSDDLGVFKVEVFGAWRLVRSESNIEVGAIDIPVIDLPLYFLSGATSQEEYYNDRIQSLDILLKEQKSLLKAHKSEQDKETKAASKSVSQPKSKGKRASSGVSEVNI